VRLVRYFYLLEYHLVQAVEVFRLMLELLLAKQVLTVEIFPSSRASRQVLVLEEALTLTPELEFLEVVLYLSQEEMPVHRKLLRMVVTLELSVAQS
jgi:cytochrome c oxidase subunit IV